MLILVQNCCGGDSLALGTISFPPPPTGISVPTGPTSETFTPHLLESQSPPVPLQRNSPPPPSPPPGILVSTGPSSETFTPHLLESQSPPVPLQRHSPPPPTSWNLSLHRSLFRDIHPPPLGISVPTGPSLETFTPHLLEYQSPPVPLQRHSPPTYWNISPHQSLFRDIHPPPTGISVPTSPSSETLTHYLLESQSPPVPFQRQLGVKWV